MHIFCIIPSLVTLKGVLKDSVGSEVVERFVQYHN